MKPSDTHPRITNFLTIDVEDYFQVHAFSRTIRTDQWGSFELRVEKNTERILQLLAREGTEATFFVLGWIAERAPDLVRKIHEAGHEVASHGYGHQHIGRQTPEGFRQDIRRSKKILEQITGKPVLGYRAPTYSITNRTLWALTILAEEGYRYDSSIFPIRHDQYGIPSAPREPFRILLENGNATCFEDLKIRPVQLPLEGCEPAAPGEILEIPVATFRMLGVNIPVAGGGYFRIFPYRFVKWGLKRVSREGRAFVFYLHPWEIDPDQPRIPHLPLRSRFRHYTHLDKTEQRLQSLVRDFPFTRISSLFPD